MATHPGERLNDAELRDLVRLLARYAEHDLDQFDNWQIETAYGPVYVAISRELAPGWPAEAFAPIWPPLPHTAKGVAGATDDASGG
ncbi:hypothetical protein [Actinoplanes sp. NPDC026619]|uniref:hypothetical protein n=1 Tax=Actinoplanes sp. NPDC026619 TaxID=3155798 RepID=UPI0034062242